MTLLNNTTGISHLVFLKSSQFPLNSITVLSLFGRQQFKKLITNAVKFLEHIIQSRVRQSCEFQTELISKQHM